MERASSLSQASDDPPMKEAGRLLHQWVCRHQQQESARQRLKDAVELQPSEMPFLVDRQLESQHFETLADALDPVFEGGHK